MYYFREPIIKEYRAPITREYRAPITREYRAPIKREYKTVENTALPLNANKKYYIREPIKREYKSLATTDTPLFTNKDIAIANKSNMDIFNNSYLNTLAGMQNIAGDLVKAQYNLLPEINKYVYDTLNQAIPAQDNITPIADYAALMQNKLGNTIDTLLKMITTGETMDGSRLLGAGYRALNSALASTLNAYGKLVPEAITGYKEARALPINLQTALAQQALIGSNAMLNPYVSMNSVLNTQSSYLPKIATEYDANAPNEILLDFMQNLGINDDSLLKQLLEG